MSDDHLQVILRNHMVFQTRGVSCVTELDVAHLNNKQYMRKSYQSNMDLSKELQLDANVLEDDQSVPIDGITFNTFSTNDEEKHINNEQKVPPPKPSRKPNLSPVISLNLVPDEMVIVPIRPWQGEGQGRNVGSPTDHTSAMEVKSRVSSFISTKSSFSKSHKHSRSKSESLGVRPVGESILDVPRISSRSPSPTAGVVKSQSSSTKTLTPPRSPISPNAHGSYVKEDFIAPRHILPRLVMGKKGMITGNAHVNPKEGNTHTSVVDLENTDDNSKQTDAVEVEGVTQASKKKHDSFLRELNNRCPRPANSYSTPDFEEGQASAGIHPKEQCADNKLSEKEVFLLDTPFALSRMSKLKHSQKIKQTSGERSRQHSGDSILERRQQIRNSAFISNDEDGSILEDKPLSHLAQLAASEGLSLFQRGWPMELVLHPNQSLGFSEWEELAKNSDSEQLSPTYYYGGDGQVDEADLPDKEGYPSQPLSTPPENYRLSNITENLPQLSDSIMREGFLHRTFLMRDGRKVRKNWTNSYTRYIVHSFDSECSGVLYFSKNKDDEKKAEVFEFFSPCYLEHPSDKKTSRQQVLGLRNGHETEVLLQFEEKEIAEEWFKLLNNHEGMEYNVNTSEKEDKKGKKSSEKIKRQSSVEQLGPDNKGIKDKLRNFIRRRPMKETLENKGIYKESVFGSTLAELKLQDKTNIPIFVLQCIKNIQNNDENLKTDGIYRISGNAAQIQKIRFEVAQRKYIVLSQEKEIHNLSGALKLFFRELKEPLIPYENYEDFIRATGSEYRRMNQQADKLMKAVNKLPVENRDTLKFLMQHLLTVSEYESENRMSLSNLAIVFGPCLMWPKVTLSHDLMTDVMLHNRVVEGLLSDFSKIFR